MRRLRASDEPRIERPYCLRCYVALAPFEDAVQPCPRCGHENLRVDQRLSWTQEPWLRQLETAAKTLIVLLGLGLAWAIWHGARNTMHLGTGQGWVAGLPILASAALWDTASKITRRDPYLRAGLLWSWLLGIVGGLALFVGGGATAAGTSAGPLIAGVGLGLLLFALGVPRLGRAFETWQVRRIQRGQGASAGSPAAAPH